MVSAKSILQRKPSSNILLFSRPLLAFERKASATIQNHLQQDQAKEQTSLLRMKPTGSLNSLILS